MSTKIKGKQLLEQSITQENLYLVDPVNSYEAATKQYVDDRNKLSGLTDVNINSLVNSDVLIYNNSSQKWNNYRFSAFTEDTYLYKQDGEPSGFIDRTSSVIALNTITREFKIEPTSSSFNYFNNSRLYNITTAITYTVPNALNSNFIYFNETNTFTQSTTPWSFNGTTQIAYIFWNPSGNTTGTVASPTYSPDGFMLEERHGHTMDWATHQRLHNDPGTVVVSSGFLLGGYTVQPGTATFATNTFSISSGGIADEDIITVLPNFNDPSSDVNSRYTIFYRLGTNPSDWRWFKNWSLPYISGATYITYNQNNVGSYQLTQLGSNQYVNYYLFGVPSVDTGMSYIIIPGQAVYTSLANAQAESVISLDFGNLPFTEIVALYKITWRANNTYTTTLGRTRIETAPTRIVGTRVTISGLISPTNHNSLSNRTDPDSHPATAISTDVTNFNRNLTSSDTDVQLALVKFNDYIGHLSGLTDVSITSLSSEQILIYSATTQKWTNRDTIDSSTIYYTKSEIDTMFSGVATTGNTVTTNTTQDITAAKYFKVGLFVTGLTIDGVEFKPTQYVTTGTTQNISGQKTFNSAVFMLNGLYVSGTTTFVNTQNLNIKDNLILINSGETGSGVTLQYAGIEVDRGSSPRYGFYFDENGDYFRVGVTGQTQAVATREDVPLDGGVAIWNASNYIFETSNINNNFLSANTYIPSDSNFLSANTLFSNGLTKTDNLIELGGTLTKDTNIDGRYNLYLGGTEKLYGFRIFTSGNTTNNTLNLSNNQCLLQSDYNNITTQLNFFGGVAYLKVNDIDEPYNFGHIGLTKSDIAIQISYGLSNSSSYQLSSEEGIIIYDEIWQRGVTYKNDYSSNYTDRSLVDKEYVDLKTSGNTDLTNYYTKTETDSNFLSATTIIVTANMFLSANTSYYTQVQANSNFLSANTYLGFVTTGTTQTISAIKSFTNGLTASTIYLDTATPKLIFNNGSLSAPSNINTSANGDRAILWNGTGYKGAWGFNNYEQWFQGTSSSNQSTFAFRFYAGANSAPVDLLSFGQGSNVNGFVWNETGLNLNARFETPGNSHMLFVQGSTNRVGINNSSPGYTLDVSGDTNIQGQLLINGSVVYYTKTETNGNFLSANTYIPTSTDFLSANTSYYTQVQANSNFLSANTILSAGSLSGLTDVAINSLVDNQVLVYSATTETWYNTDTIDLMTLLNLSGLTDVNINNPSSGQVLTYNGSVWVNSGISSTDLSNYYTKTQSNANFLSANTSYYTQVQANSNFLSATTVITLPTVIQNISSGTTTFNSETKTIDTTNISYKLVKYDYVIYSGTTNMRGGLITIINNETITKANEVVTEDIGNTSTVTFTTDIDGSDSRLRVISSTSGWEIKYIKHII